MYLFYFYNAKINASLDNAFTQKCKTVGYSLIKQNKLLIY